MSYCESTYGYDGAEDINLNSQFEYAVTIGIMIDENYHASFTSMREDLDKLIHNMYKLKSNFDMLLEIRSSKSKMLLLECIDKIHDWGLNWCDELSEDPGEDLDELRNLVHDIIYQSQQGFGIFYSALENRRQDNVILRNKLDV